MSVVVRTVAIVMDVAPTEPSEASGPESGRTVTSTLSTAGSVLANYVLPAVMALVFVFGVAVLASRVDLLASWSGDHDGNGQHVVRACEPVEDRSGNRWVCEGTLVVDGTGTEVRADLVTSRDATVSAQPYVGQRNKVFFDPGRIGTVYPTTERLNELTRLYVSVLPRLLLTVGAATWLAGWALTRRLDTRDLLVRDKVRLPGRFGWRSRGLQWILMAGLALLGAHLLTTRVIGSLASF